MVLVPASSAASLSGGTTLWVDRVTPEFLGSAVVASPDGSRVFVLGAVDTFAYDSATGKHIWMVRRRGMTAIAVSPDGSKVFVTGTVIPVINPVTGTGPGDY